MSTDTHGVLAPISSNGSTPLPDSNAADKWAQTPVRFPGRRLKEKERKEMRDMRRAGVNLEDIATHFNTSPGTVSRHTKRAFAAHKAGKKSAPECSTIWVRQEDATWLSACATVYGVPIHEVHGKILSAVRKEGVNKFME